MKSAAAASNLQAVAWAVQRSCKDQQSGGLSESQLGATATITCEVPALLRKTLGEAAPACVSAGVLQPVATAA